MHQAPADRTVVRGCDAGGGEGALPGGPLTLQWAGCGVGVVGEEGAVFGEQAISYERFR